MHMMRLLKDNGLTIVLLTLFAFSFGGLWLFGWLVVYTHALRHGQPTLALLTYSLSPEFLSSVFENWESEFLQMSAYVLLTAFLIQRGSAESRDPDAPPRDADLGRKAGNKSAPAILRLGPIARALYAQSLGLALGLFFILSFIMHWIQSARAAAEDAIAHDELAPTIFGYLGDPQLWFESFQNWQSEFLSTAVLVVLSIFLRQRESPESKAVAAPHSKTGA